MFYSVGLAVPSEINQNAPEFFCIQRHKAFKHFRRSCIAMQKNKRLTGSIFFIKNGAINVFEKRHFHTLPFSQVNDWILLFQLYYDCSMMGIVDLEI